MGAATIKAKRGLVQSTCSLQTATAELLSLSWLAVSCRGSNLMLPCAPLKQARAVASSAVQTAEEHALHTTARRLCGRCGKQYRLPQHRASQTCLTDRLGSSLRHATC